MTHHDSSALKLSPLYTACRQNDINSVAHILSNLSVEEINQIEPNGSTALHVAAYNGHDDIVRLLINRGASITIKNKFGLKPEQEARTEETRKIFQNRGELSGEKRFVGEANSIEWLTVNERANEYAAFYRRSLKEAFDDGLDREQLVLYLKEIIINDPKGMPDVINNVVLFFESNNAVQIIRAYTVESSFYRTLNEDLAKMINHRDHTDTELNLAVDPAAGIAALLTFDKNLEKLSFVGNTFRGMVITKNDLNQYKPGSVIMTKSFLSTSKDRATAEKFAANQASRKGPGGELIKFPVICYYTIRNSHTALSVETCSAYPNEKEVIILPINVFKVASVAEKNGHFEIRLIEQDRLAAYELEFDSVTDICRFMWYFGCPWCYRKCCMRFCGVVEEPES